MFKLTSSFFIALFLVVGAVSFAVADKHDNKDIVDTAVSAGQFNTLAAALTAAGLVETLKSPGPFTVFAPTDDTFALLGDEYQLVHCPFDVYIADFRLSEALVSAAGEPSLTE